MISPQGQTTGKTARASRRPRRSQGLTDLLDELARLWPELSVEALRLEAIRLLFAHVGGTRAPQRIYEETFAKPYPKELKNFAAFAGADLDNAAELPDLYEALLKIVPRRHGETNDVAPLGADLRKQTGCFYTPPALALAMTTRLLEQAGPSKTGKRKNFPTLFDPALGSGVFLLAALRSFRDRFGGEPAQLLPHLFGMDRDAGAVETARLALWAEARRPGQFGDFLKGQLGVGNTLEVEPESFEPGPFDLVVANPPYLSVKQGLPTEERLLYEARYQTAQGQYDLYGLFLEQSLRLLKPGGHLAFLLPKPFLVNEQQTPARELLLQNEIVEIWDLGRTAFSLRAAVESAVIFVRKKPPGFGHGIVARTAKVNGILEAEPPSVVEQATLALHPEKHFNLWLTSENVRFLNAVERKAQPLESWLLPHSGRGMEMGKGACSPIPVEGWLPVLTGEEAGAFWLPQSPKWHAPFDPEDPKRCKSRALYEGPKLVVRRVANRVIAGVDEAPGTLTLNTLYNLHPKNAAQVHALCAVLNSTVVQRWFKQRFYFCESLFPYLRQNQVYAIPLPPLSRWMEPPSKALRERATDWKIPAQPAVTLFEMLPLLSIRLHELPVGSPARVEPLELLESIVQALYRLPQSR